MKRALFALGVLGCVCAISSLALSRSWKSADGRYRTEAELVDFSDGKATLKKANGKAIEVPLLSLCPEDQQFIKERFPGAASEDFRPGAEYRKWKSQNGKFSILAEFVTANDERVQLRRQDGTELSVELEMLSDGDQEWVTNKLREMKEEEDQEESKPKKGGARASEDISGDVGEQDIVMKLVRLDQSKTQGKRARGGAPSGLTDYILGLVQPQQFYSQTGRSEAQNAAFHKLVTKEPKYKSATPFRGIAMLGDRQYGFALDAADGDKGYDRLYFDVNGNGDLTDDPSIAACEVTQPNQAMSQSQFPRVDLTLNSKGESFDYGFLMSAMCRGSGSSAYTIVSLYSGVVQEGYVAQGSRRTKVLLLDGNSNGRFDDVASFEGGSVRGDLLLVNPEPDRRASRDVTMGKDRNYLGKVVCLDKGFYRTQIGPGGSRLKLSPMKPPMGTVHNGSPSYRALLQNDEYGTIIIAGNKGQKLPLPEGTWKVVSYSIDAGGGKRGRTAVAAGFHDKPSEVTVAKGEDVKLPFGAPFRAVVSANRTGDDKVYLSLEIVGSAGEKCTNFIVKGTRPPAPKFIVKDSEGKTVKQGSFEYG
jgi:hypothetical protein